MAGFMFPKIRCISVPTGLRMTTSVVTRSYWLRGTWAATQKQLVIKSFFIDWISTCTMSFERSKEPWKDEWVWRLHFLTLFIHYRPRWVSEAAEVYVKSKYK
jgi:hypothetical protein